MAATVLSIRAAGVMAHVVTSVVTKVAMCEVTVVMMVIRWSMRVMIRVLAGLGSDGENAQHGSRKEDFSEHEKLRQLLNKAEQKRLLNAFRSAWFQ